MAEINLLPIDLSPSSGTAKSANTLKKVIVGLTIIFVLLGGLGAAGIILYTNELSSLNNEQTSLKQKIQSLEETEQKLFLVKDRIAKINLVNAEVDVTPEMTPLNTLLLNLPTNVSIGDVVIDSNGTKFSVVSSDSLGMAAFLNQLATSGLYKNLTLSGFRFEPNTGYTISLST